METINSSNYQFRYDGDRRFPSSCMSSRLIGKRFHGIEGNAYDLPNDQQEFERLDAMHNSMKALWDGLNILAPISPHPSLILDIGTGSGSWVIDVAEEYPNTRVIGMDLSPIQPLSVPPNAEFQVGDLTVDLASFHQMSFDLIHSRLIKLGVLEWQWNHYVEQVFDLLKPGTGWAQFGETTQLSWDGDAVPPDRPMYFVCCLQETRLTKVSKVPPRPLATSRNSRRMLPHHRTNAKCRICRYSIPRQEGILWRLESRNRTPDGSLLATAQKYLQSDSRTRRLDLFQKGIS